MHVLYRRLGTKFVPLPSLDSITSVNEKNDRKIWKFQVQIYCV